MSQDAHHGKGHASKVTEGISHKHPWWVPVWERGSEPVARGITKSFSHITHPGHSASPDPSSGSEETPISSPSNSLEPKVLNSLFLGNHSTCHQPLLSRQKFKNTTNWRPRKHLTWVCTGLASPSGDGSWSGPYLPHVQIVVPLSTGLLTSYGRAIPRWWKKRVSWSRGKRHDHPDNHLWKQGKKKEGKTDSHFLCIPWSYFCLPLSYVPICIVHLSQVIFKNSQPLLCHPGNSQHSTSFMNSF